MDKHVKPDYSHVTLLTIDVQNDFTLSNAPLEVSGTREVLSRIRELVSVFRQCKKPIIHIVRLYLADGSNADLCRRKAIENGKKAVVPNSNGAELVEDIKPSLDVRLDSQKLLSGELQLIAPMEWVMYKPRWGAFFRTPLQRHLEELAINTVVVSGCNFPNCPRTTVYEASERDFRIVLAVDAVSKAYEQGLTELSNIGVALRSSAEIIELIDNQK
jgi:nicotinamidase-related amidase